MAWQTVTDTALSGHHQRRPACARAARSRAATTRTARPSASRSPKEIDQLIESVKSEANASYGGRYVFSGTATDTQALRDRRRRHLRGRQRQRSSATIGPGVSVADQRDRRQRARLRRRRRQAARHAPQHRRRTCAAALPADQDALRNGDISALDTNLDSGQLGQRDRSARRPTASTAAKAASRRSRRTPRSCSRTSRTPTWRRPHRLLNPTGRLPVRPEGRGEHRPNLADGFPPLASSRAFKEPRRFNASDDRQLTLRDPRDPRGRSHRIPARPHRPERDRVTHWSPRRRAARLSGCTRSTTRRLRLQSRTRSSSSPSTRSCCLTARPSASASRTRSRPMCS